MFFHLRVITHDLLTECVNRFVLLTRLGGGAFGNADPWIDDAIARALTVYADAPLDVRLVSYSRVPRQMRALEAGRTKPR